MDVSNLYLGQGITFPFILDNGAIVVNTYSQTIEASLKTILSWEFGRKFFTPTLGSKIWQTLGLPNEAITQALVKRYLIDAISLWENRVTLLDVTLTVPKAYTISITLNYMINATKTPGTLTHQYVG
jgi:hypothetical protein